MKFKTEILLIVLLVSTLSAQDPQRYQGGSGDGYDLLAFSDIFLDGSTLTAKYQGGTGDGYDLLSSLDSFLNGSALTTRYQGGSGDGYDLLASLNSFLDGGALTARYQGGSGDGYDLLASLNSFLDGGALTARYEGGINDGYALLASGDIQLGVPTPLVFRVERSTGNVFAAGSFIPAGADLAERIDVSEPVEPGDVVELDPEKPHTFRKARASSRRVAGVITGEPGFILGNKELVVSGEWSESRVDGRPMLALLGRVPVKATTENGPIRPGDLLTVSSKAGYAMRCMDYKKCEGAVVGKALQGLERGQGVIMVLVMTR